MSWTPIRAAVGSDVGPSGDSAGVGRGPADAAGGVRPAVHGDPGRARAAAAAHGRRHDRAPGETRTQDVQGHRRPARSGASGPPEVPRAGAVGPSTSAQDAGPSGRRGPRRAGRRDRIRPLGVCQEGDEVARRGAAMVRSARQGRELSGRCLHGGGATRGGGRRRGRLGLCFRGRPDERPVRRRTPRARARPIRPPASRRGDPSPRRPAPEHRATVRGRLPSGEHRRGRAP